MRLHETFTRGKRLSRDALEYGAAQSRHYKVRTLGIATVIVIAVVGVGTLSAATKSTKDFREPGDIIGSQQTVEHYRDGSSRNVIKYAKLAKLLDNQLPHIDGVALSREVADKRTFNSRTFQAVDGRRVLEVIGGKPQYYKDPDGGWWQVDYATTTPQDFKNREFAPELQRNRVMSWLRTAFAEEATFYPQPDPETSSFDGTVEYNPGAGGGTWENSRDATTGSGTTDNETSGYTLTGRNGANSGFVIARTIIGFDTSAIEDGSTIDSATSSVYIIGKANEDNDGDDFIAVVHASPDSNTGISSTDFDAFTGLPEAITEGSNRLDLTDDIAPNSRIDFVLNSNGRSWINTTGVTWLGLAEGHDILDNPYDSSGSNSHNSIAMGLADRYGTAEDPRLTVVYTLPNVAPSAPTSLWVEGTSSALYVATNTPRFSAIYNDSNSGDHAGFYRVQISATSSFGGSLVWDSGKSSMTNTVSGTRSPNVVYGGTPIVFNGTSYYWRIKFWDAMDEEGAWSNPSTFTMGVICAPTP